MRTGITGTQTRKRAEETRRFADVGRLEPQVVIEIRAVAVTPFAFAIRQRAQAEQIRRLEQLHAVVERQPFAGSDLFADVSKAVCHAASVRFLSLRILRFWHNRRHPEQSGKLGAVPPFVELRDQADTVSPL